MSESSPDVSYIQFRFEAGMPTVPKAQIQIFGSNCFLVTHMTHGLGRCFLARVMAQLDSAYLASTGGKKVKRECNRSPYPVVSLSYKLGLMPCNLMHQIHSFSSPVC